MGGGLFISINMGGRVSGGSGQYQGTIPPLKQDAQSAKQMSSHFPFILSTSTSQSLTKLSYHINGGLIETTKNLHGYWSENYALSCTRLAILAHLLLIAVSKSMARLHRSTVNKLGLEA